jgi:hypothetical protein
MITMTPHKTIGAVISGVILKLIAAVPPRVDNTKPPELPPVVPKFGSYCIKAQCHLRKSDGKIKSDFQGYDTKEDISSRTYEYCKKVAKDDQYCSVPKTTMLPQNKFVNCSGQIVYTNHETGTVSLMFPD